MMPEKVEAVRYVCGCGAVELCEADEEPYGYHGTAYLVGRGETGDPMEWWACEPRHIALSVKQAAAR